MTQPTTNDQQQQPATGTTDDIPEGMYEAIAVGEDEPNVQFGESNNGNEQVAIEMNLLDLNRTCFVIMSFSTKAAPYSLERLRAMGWDGGDTMKGITTNKVTVRAKRDYYEDEHGNQKSSMKFEIMTGQRFSFQKPMDDQQKRGFFAKLKQLAEQGPAPRAASGGSGAGGGGAGKGSYPADWDNNGPAKGAPGGPPRVDLG